MFYLNDRFAKLFKNPQQFIAMITLNEAAWRAVNTCVGLKKNEKVCIITDKAAGKVGDAIRSAVCSITHNIEFFVMEDFGERPSDGINPIRFPDKIGNALSKSDASFYAASVKKGELESFRSPMLDIVDKLKTIRHAHMPGTTPRVIRLGMNTDYLKMQKSGLNLCHFLQKSEKIHVTSPNGTDFTAEFNPDYRWVLFDGIVKNDKWQNLPEGEVFTCVGNINGTAIVDGVLGDSFDSKYGLLNKNPVHLDIKNGRISGVECKNENIARDIIEYTKQDKNSNRIGEFAIGINTGIKKLIGNLLLDEKFPGVHIAIGHGYPKDTKADWDSVAHADCVMQKCTVDVDGNIIMENGKFTNPF